MSDSRNETIFCTIASSEYAPMVKLLVESFFKFHTNNKFIIFSGDHYNLDGMAGGDKLEWRKLNLGLFSQSKRLTYSRVKPAVLRSLVDEGWETIIYLDPDILVMSPLDDLMEIVAENALTLTPHILNIDEENAIEKFDKTLLNAGMFNAGFIGLSQSQETKTFLHWWESRTSGNGAFFANSGLNYDQRWLDLAPGYVERLFVLRDPGVNVAYYNLIDRRVVFENCLYRVNGSTLKLIHFSGFNPELLPSSSIYQPDVLVSDFGPLEDLFRLYAEKLLALGWKTLSAGSEIKGFRNFRRRLLALVKSRRRYL
jgi:hypothetical protein